MDKIVQIFNSFTNTNNTNQVMDELKTLFFSKKGSSRIKKHPFIMKH